MPDDEFFHLVTRNEGRGFDTHVSQSKFSTGRIPLTLESSLSGGFLMVVVGVIYLVFEKGLLAKSQLAGDSTAPGDNILSRSLIGVQVRDALTRFENLLI